MNITVTVDEVTLESVIRQAYGEDDPASTTVGGEVARLLVAHVIRDHDGWPTFRDAVTQIRDEEIRAAVAPLIADALTKPVPQTNQWGEPTGPSTTLSEIVVAEARRQLTAKSGDHYSSDRRTIVEKLVATEVQKAFAEVIADEVRKARAMVAADIGQHVAKAVQAGLAKR